MGVGQGSGFHSETSVRLGTRRSTPTDSGEGPMKSVSVTGDPRDGERGRSVTEIPGSITVYTGVGEREEVSSLKGLKERQDPSLQNTCLYSDEGPTVVVPKVVRFPGVSVVSVPPEGPVSRHPYTLSGVRDPVGHGRGGEGDGVLFTTFRSPSFGSTPIPLPVPVFSPPCPSVRLVNVDLTRSRFSV